MRKKSLLVLIEQDEDGIYIASVPSLPGCYTQAKNLDTLMSRIKEAIGLYIDANKKALDDIGSLKFIGLQQIDIDI